MKKIFAIISLAALMMPVSCMKEDLAGPEAGINSGKTMTFTAVMEGAATKTVLDKQTGAVSWAAGDAVKFDYAIGKTDSEPVISASLAEGDIKDGAATFTANVPAEFALTDAEFAATVEEGVKRYMYVAYPATVQTTYTTAGQAYHLFIPSVQDGVFANASISLAKWDKLNPTAPLAFKNLCGLIQVTVGENVRQIKLTSSEYISGRANIGFTEANTPYIKNMVEDEASKVVTVNVEAAGTYYIAVAPGTIKELYIEQLDAAGQAICDKLAKGDVTVNRAHILPLGGFAEGSFAAADGFFVKPEAAGTGDGSSWDNAANYETFRSKLAASVDNEVAVVYMAGGTYSVTAVANVSATGKNYKIYGGYPADATGYSLSGRDVTLNQTILQSDGKSHRIWNLKYGTYLIDGIKFMDSAYSEGGALNIQLTTDLNCKNCIFENCSATKNGGAVQFSGLTSTGSVFENCQFIENKVSGETSGGGFGSAVGAFGTAGSSAGLVTFKNCLFKDNQTKYAGAVASRITSMRFLDCNFIDNVSTSEDAEYRASALYIDASAVDAHVYFDRCYIANSKSLSSSSSKASLIVNYSDRTDICINNTVTSGFWGYGSTHAVVNYKAGKILISNSTMLTQAGSVVYNKSTGSVKVVNSILLNASGGMISCKADDGEITLNNSLCSTTTVSGTDCALNLNVKASAAADVKFPVSGSWNSGNAATMKEDNETTTANVDDCRGKVYYYAWDGTYPSGVVFTPTTLQNVTNLVTAADANFATWLGDSLGKDIRGKSRDADSMWPGSYQN